MSDQPVIKYEWPLTHRPTLTRIRNGRRVTVLPSLIRVSLERSGWCVYIEGRTIKANGDYGQHRRVHWFDENPPEWSDGGSLEELPAWACAYLEYAQGDRARAGVVAEEPLREYTFMGPNGSHDDYAGLPTTSLEEALDIARLFPGKGQLFERIVCKDGPWVPVQQEGATS